MRCLLNLGASCIAKFFCNVASSNMVRVMYHGKSDPEIDDAHYSIYDGKSFALDLEIYHELHLSVVRQTRYGPIETLDRFWDGVNSTRNTNSPYNIC